MIIPLNTVSADALNAIIEAFVLREGTDYGQQDFELTDKIAQVRTQLENHQAFLLYSQLHETVNIVPASEVDTSETPIYGDG